MATRVIGLSESGQEPIVGRESRSIAFFQLDAWPGVSQLITMPGDVTELLDALEHNDSKAAEELLPMVYHELRRLADIMMAGERPGHTLQPTALVHEAWLRLVGSNCEWRNRTHFVNTAAEAMRRVLVDRARQKGRLKRGGGWIRESFDSLDLAQAADDERLLLVNEAMDDLARGRPVEAQVVKLRYFVGLNHSEIAQALGLSERHEDALGLLRQAFASPNHDCSVSAKAYAALAAWELGRIDEAKQWIRDAAEALRVQVQAGEGMLAPAWWHFAATDLALREARKRMGENEWRTIQALDE